MATEKNNGFMPVLCSDGCKNGTELLHAKADVAGNDKHVRILANGVLEPLLLDRVLDFLDDGVVGIASKVKDEAKGDNFYSLVFCLELAIALGKRSLVARFGVYVVEI